MEMFAENQGLRKGKSPLEGSLDKSSIISPASPQIEIPAEYQGMNLTAEQFQKIAEYAELLSRRDRELPFQERIKEDIPQDGIPVEGAYRLAREMLNVEPVFMTRALLVISPTTEQKVQDLSNLSAKPSSFVVMSDYLREFREQIKEGLPVTEKFNAYSSYGSPDYLANVTDHVFIARQVVEKRKGFMGKLKEKILDVSLAKFSFSRAHYSPSDENVDVDLYDPIILRLFNKKLNILEKRWELHYDFTYHYNPYEK